jgi:hypothetical protein
MQKENGPHIAFNTANAALQSLSEQRLIQYGQSIQEMGYERVSALPFRTPEIVELYQKYFPPVVLVEDAWNPGHFDNLTLAFAEGIYGHLKRLSGDTTEPPILQDTLLFPGLETATDTADYLMEVFPEAHIGSTHFWSAYPQEKTYVHIMSEYKPHQMGAHELLKKSQDTGSLLLFDPTHLLDPAKVSYPGHPTDIPQDEWERQLEFFSSRVAGIDIRAANPADLTELLTEGGKLYRLAKAGFAVCQNLDFLRVETLVPIQEQHPLSPLHKRAVHYLKTAATLLKEIRQESLD